MIILRHGPGQYHDVSHDARNKWLSLSLARSQEEPHMLVNKERRLVREEMSRDCTKSSLGHYETTSRNDNIEH